MNNDPNLYEGQKLVKDANGFFMKMYGYMAAAVGISAVTAFMAANVPSVVSLVSNGLVMSILFIMQLVLVFRMSSLKAIRTSGKALSSLIFYSMIEGLFLSGLLYKYTAMGIHCCSSSVCCFGRHGNKHQERSFWNRTTGIGCFDCLDYRQHR